MNRVVCIWFDGTETWLGLANGSRLRWGAGNCVSAASHVYMAGQS